MLFNRILYSMCYDILFNFDASEVTHLPCQGIFCRDRFYLQFLLLLLWWFNFILFLFLADIFYLFTYNQIHELFTDIVSRQRLFFRLFRFAENDHFAIFWLSNALVYQLIYDAWSNMLRFQTFFSYLFSHDHDLSFKKSMRSISTGLSLHAFAVIDLIHSDYSLAID